MNGVTQGVVIAPSVGSSALGGADDTGQQIQLPQHRQPGGKVTGFFAGSFHGGTGCGTVICVTALASAVEHVAPRYERRGSCGGSTQQSQELRWRSE
jgi:hypothetical protein